MCATCAAAKRDMDHAANQLQYEAADAAGLCRQCVRREPTPGYRSCRSCREALKARMRRARARRG